MLVFAALTSTISLLEPSVAWLIERKNLKRIPATMISGSVIWFLGFGTVLSFNHWKEIKIFALNIFELLDYVTANIMLPVGGFCIAILNVKNA